MAILTNDDFAEMRRDYFTLGQGKEDFKGTNPVVNKKAVLQAIEDYWEEMATKLAIKADMDAANGGVTLTNPQAKILGRAWLKNKAKRGG